MNNKEKLKQRLLEISINHQAFREKHRLARNLEVEMADIEPLLKELCKNKILTEKIQYICPTCGNTIIMNEEALMEELTEEGYLECDECYDGINPKEDRTGFVYYDVRDYDLLSNW